MNKKIFAMSACAALLVSCADVQEAPGVADGLDGDNRIQVALGFAPMDVVSRTRTTETVTAKSFAGQEPTEANPFHPMVWFTRTAGDFSIDTGTDYHNMVNFTSTGLTFPDEDIEYNTADKSAYTYCFGLYPNNVDLGREIWGLEASTDGWTPTPAGSVLYADITGQEDLMFAPIVKGCINDKFNSTIYDNEDPADKRLKFSHLLTWLKIRVNAAEQGAGEAWGKVKLLRVKTKQKVRVDLGTGAIYNRTNADDAGTYWVPAFVPDPNDTSNRQYYKDLEPDTPEDPAIASVLLVPATEYEIEYQTEQMPSSKFITVPMKDMQGNNIATADDARNKVFVVSLFFYQRQKVEALCTLEPMTDNFDQLYGKTMAPLDLSFTASPHKYDGSAQTVTGIEVKDGGTTLIAGTDYDISYSNNINTGTAVVTAVGKGAYAGRVGTRTFGIAKADGTGDIVYNPATGSKTFGDGPFVPTMDNNLSGDGTLSYTISYDTSDGNVATVSTDGRVTIQHAGTATITATVGDGINHQFASPSSTTYSLTVNPKAASLNYPVTSLVKTYGDDSFINRLVNTGDGMVSYSSSDADVAEVGTDGTVTVKKTTADPITITATLTPGTGTDYAYSPDHISYTLTVNKAQASISYATKNITRRKTGIADDDKFKNPLVNTGDGSVSYVSVNTAVATVNADGLVTLVGPGITTITATVTDNDKYHYDQSTVSYSLTVTN